ncbi:tRNA-modifying protein YgfZ [Candidatus Williamhamiltonella defendens]|uniref:tRNA-modifying protein YgfZ n=1 Tax=Candidatus Williamhamiltonella defendens TaxID=138072 RepID=UPI00130D8EAF|nr:tRNA-modifying protein YgfZ [Candidatus Hamiltonella defensa]
MIYQSLFSHQAYLPAEQLQFTVILLNDWGLITVTGKDRVKYLQGQITLDVPLLKEDQHILGAHCDPKGKILSTVRLFHYLKGLAFIARKSILNDEVMELRKYAVFSKVEIDIADSVVLLGIAGNQARKVLKNCFEKLPTEKEPVVHEDDYSLLYFSSPRERFLLVSHAFKKEDFLIQKLQDQAVCRSSEQWLALDIESGFPIIEAKNKAQFIPQAANLQALGGISFTKGCYTGQEVIARTEYRGVNKKALYWLTGKACRVPEVGEDLEIQMGEDYRRTGVVLAAVKLQDSSLWIQAILNHHFPKDSILRVKGDENGRLVISRRFL